MFWYCSAQSAIRKRVSASDQFGERPGLMGIADMNESPPLDEDPPDVKLCPSDEMLVKALKRDSDACCGDVGVLALGGATAGLLSRDMSERKPSKPEPLLSDPDGDNIDAAN